MPEEKYGYPAARYKNGQSRLILNEEEDQQAFADGWNEHPNNVVEIRRGPGRPPKVPNASTPNSIDKSATK